MIRHYLQNRTIFRILVLVILGTVLIPVQARLANEGKRGLYVISIDEVLNLPDDEVDLGTAALIVSEQWSEVVHGLRYRQMLDDMATEIKKRLQKLRLRPNFRAIPVINEYLFKELGFSAVTNADNPSDLFLHSVLDRRKGYCLSLSILYLALGERLGLPLHGVVVPGHFFVRYDGGSTMRFNIECTADGAQLSDEHYIKKHRVPEHHDRLYMENLTKIQSLGCLFNNFGVVYLEIGESKLALLALDLAARINPKLSEARSNLSIALHGEGYQEDALLQLEQALENNPNDPAVHHQLGQAYFKQEAYNQAVLSLKRSLELDPNRPEAYVLLADVYAAQERYRPARESLDAALDLDPENAYAHTTLGRLYGRMKDYQRAVKAYRSAIRYKPDMVEAYFGLASCYRELGWTRQEIEIYQRVLNRWPDTYAALYNLGQIHAQQKDYPTAIEYIKKAIRVDPNDASLYYNLAVCYSESQKPDLAHQAFAQALDTDPKMGVAHFGIAISYFNRGEYQIAWDHIVRARSLGFEVPKDALEQVAARAGVKP